MLTPISVPPPLYIGFISDWISSRPCATGVGMLATQMMIVENKTTVIARIRIVPMTSEIPDSSSRKTTFIEWPPGGQERITFAAEPTIYKVFAVVTTARTRENHGLQTEVNGTASERRGAHRGGASPAPPPRFLECAGTGPRGNPGGDRGGRPAVAQPRPANAQGPPGRGIRRGARCATARPEPQGARLRVDGVWCSAGPANPRRDRRDECGNRRSGDDVGRGAAGSGPRGAARIGRPRRARTDATAGNGPRTAHAPAARGGPRLPETMAGRRGPHRGRIRIPRHGEDRARLGLRGGRPACGVDGDQARRQPRVVRGLSRPLDRPTGLGPGPTRVRHGRTRAGLRRRAKAPRPGRLRGCRRTNRRCALRFPSGSSRSRQAPRPRTGIDARLLPGLLEGGRRRGTRRGTAPARPRR